jgi:hypothetical protein
MINQLLLATLNISVTGNVWLIVICAIFLIVVLFSDLVELTLGLLFLLLAAIIESVSSFGSALRGLFKRR